jgi:hypothetical protein
MTDANPLILLSLSGAQPTLAGLAAGLVSVENVKGFG